MLQSMTGFATKTLALVDDAGTKLYASLSLKSLNSRYFETTCRLPYALSHLETEFIKQLKQRLHRGHLYLTIHVSNQNAFTGSIEPSMTIVNDYVRAIKTIQERFNIEGTIEIKDVLSLPNVFSIQEKSITPGEMLTITTALDQLIDALIVTRNQEGRTMYDNFKNRIQLLRDEITIIRELSGAAVERQKFKVMVAIQELEKQETAQAEARKTALYITLDKIDINEEIDRFVSHLETLDQFLDAPSAEKGKRIDFIVQELARETNTITAKCTDAVISSHAITIKVELEKAREHAQNIV